MTAHCSHCGGWLLPSGFKDEPPICGLCGRDGREPITPDDALALRKRELGGLGRRLRKEWGANWSPRRGRPPKLEAVDAS